MIYLIKGYGEDGPLLKIGYTSDLNSRMNFYKTHTPDYKLLDTREGDLDLETGLHRYFKNYKYSTEWFRYDKFIVDNFKTVNPPIELTIPANSTRRRNLVLHGAISDLKIENKNHKTLSKLLSRLLKTIPLRTDEDVESVKECLKEEYLELTEPVLKFFEKFHNIDSSRNKMEFLCTGTKNLSKPELNCVLEGVSDFYKNFYLGLGPDRCRSLGYNFTRMKKEYSTKFFDLSPLIEELKNTFIFGKGYSSQEVKSILGSIYSKYGYKKTPKATDLETWFKVKEIKVKSSDGKWNRGIKIIGIK